MTANKTMGPAEWAMLIALSVLWGGSFFFNQVAVAEWPPFTVVAVRVVLAAAILHVVLRARGLRLPTGRAALLAFLGMGILNNAIPFSLLVWGQTQIASGLASILNATTPLFTVAIATLATSDDKLTPGRAVGIVAGIVGVAVLIGTDVLAALGAEVWAQIACLGAALSYGCASVFGRRFARLGISPMATATGQVTASSLILLPLAFVVDQPWTLPAPSLAAAGSLIAVASVSTALAYLLFFRILATAGATNISLVTFLVPVSAILLGVLILGERLAASDFVGFALIGIGLAAIDGRPLRWLRGARTP